MGFHNKTRLKSQILFALEAKNNIKAIFRVISHFYMNLCNNYSTSTK